MLLLLGSSDSEQYKSNQNIFFQIRSAPAVQVSPEMAVRRRSVRNAPKFP